MGGVDVVVVVVCLLCSGCSGGCHLKYRIVVSPSVVAVAVWRCSFVWAVSISSLLLFVDCFEDAAVSIVRRVALLLLP